MPLRIALGKRQKWICRDCKKRFYGHHQTGRTRVILLMSCGVIVTWLALDVVRALLVVHMTPVSYVKHKVVVVYKWIYGPEHKRKLDEHLGWLYHNKDDEKREFYQHE